MMTMTQIDSKFVRRLSAGLWVLFVARLAGSAAGGEIRFDFEAGDLQGWTVVEGGRVIGLISIGDVVKSRIEETVREAEELKARIKNLLAQRKRLHEHFRKYGLVEIEEKHITPVDQEFLQKALAVINEHISDSSFGVEKLANYMAVSRSLLLKKIDALIGEKPVELIRRTRLNKAAKLIESSVGNISEIALEVGFSNPSYFAESFRKQFGVAPTQYHNKSANI